MYRVCELQYETQKYDCLLFLHFHKIDDLHVIIIWDSNLSSLVFFNKQSLDKSNQPPQAQMITKSYSGHICAHLHVLQVFIYYL